jgi:arginase family enzyme
MAVTGHGGRRVGLLGVPTTAGSHNAGQDKAPAALRAAGLVERLAAQGVAVRDFGDLPEASVSGVADTMGMTHLLGGGADELARLERRAGSVLVHFDVDVLDTGAVPAGQLPALRGADAGRGGGVPGLVLP